MDFYKGDNSTRKGWGRTHADRTTLSVNANHSLQEYAAIFTNSHPKSKRPTEGFCKPLHIYHSKFKTS